MTGIYPPAEAANGADLGGLGEWLPSVQGHTAALVGEIADWWGHTDTLTSVLGPIGLGMVSGATAMSGALLAAKLRGYRTAEGAVWLAITPPADLPADGGVALWRMVAGRLRRTRRPGWRGLFTPPARLAVEWWADSGGVRPGVWVPASLSAGTVADAIRRAWPGARVSFTHPPVWHVPPTGHLELSPTGGAWAPLIDPHSRPPRGGSAPNQAAGVEPLRAVLAALATRRPGEQACVQLVVTRSRGVFAELAGTLSGGRGGAGLAGALRALAPALLGTIAGSIALIALGLVDLFVPGESSLARRRRPRSTTARATDPVVIAARKAADAKRANGPHLRATLRIAVNTSTSTRTSGRDRDHLRGARGAATDIAAGYDLVLTGAELSGRWARHSDAVATRAPGGGFTATLEELAALWHLPSEPGRYRLPDPAAVRRRAGLGLPATTANPYTDPARRDGGPRRPSGRGPAEPPGRRPPGHPSTSRPTTTPTRPAQPTRYPHHR
jgi:hypothetical protein